MGELSPNIYTAIVDHLETGTPIADHGLTPDQVKRIHVCTMLYKYWCDHPFCRPRLYLEKVAHRTKTEIVNDIKVFNFIKQQMDDFSISRDDAMHIALRYTEKMFRAADATGDTATMDRALKHWTKLNQLDKDAPPEDVASRTAEMPVFFTRDIHVIDPDRQKISLEMKNSILEKYGGTPDKTLEAIEAKKRAMLQMEEAEDVGLRSGYIQEVSDEPHVIPPPTIPDI